MEKNISPAGMTCIVLVAVASVVGVSYASFAITRNSANEGNQEVVTQAEAATTSWTSTYNGKSVTGSQVVNLLNNADSRGISVFISTRGIERKLTTTNNTPVLKHNGKYYVNYGTTYNYEDSSYGYVEGEANYTGDSALLQVRDGQSLKTNYSPKFDNSTIVKNKDFSAAYNVGSPTYIESTAKFDANLIYGPDGEVTGVILSQSTKSTASTALQLGTSSSGGGFVNGSGAMGGTSGSYIPTHSNSGNIPLASASNNGTVAGGTVTKVPSNSKPANNLKQETNYGVSDKLDINQEGAVKVDVSTIDDTGLGFVAIKVSDETPTEKQLLTEQYMLYLKYDIPGFGDYENISYIYDDRLQGNGDFLYYEDEWPFVVVNKNNVNVMGLEIPEKGMYLLYPQNIKEMGGTFEYTIEKKQFVQFYLDGVPYKAYGKKDVDFWNGSAYSPEGGTFDHKDMYHIGNKIFPEFKFGYPIEGKNYTSVSNIITFTIDGKEYKSEYNMYWGRWFDSEYNTSNLYFKNFTIKEGNVNWGKELLLTPDLYAVCESKFGDTDRNSDIKPGGVYKTVFAYGDTPVNELCNTTWKFNTSLTDYTNVFGTFDFENQSGWEDFPSGCYMTDGVETIEISGLAITDCFGYKVFGTVQSFDSEWSFSYFPRNNLGFEEGWYRSTGDSVRALCNGEVTLDNLNDWKDQIIPCNPPTIKFSSDLNSALENKKLINWLYVNGVLK